jgi:hypothetical protein
MPVHLSHVYPARLAGDDQTRRGFEVVRNPQVRARSFAVPSGRMPSGSPP